MLVDGDQGCMCLGDGCSVAWFGKAKKVEMLKELYCSC